jgi:L-iditol 2-dehydrogenase
MKAGLKTADGPFSIEDVDVSTLRAVDRVKARIRTAGIWGSDLRRTSLL